MRHWWNSPPSPCAIPFAKCDRVGLKPEYTLDELDHFEALSGRFARTADLYTQKLLKSLFMVLGEDAVSFLDKARLAEQLAVIESAEELAAIRDLRNTIAHEYTVANLNEVFRSALEFSGRLLDIIASTQRYVREKLPPDPPAGAAGIPDPAALPTASADLPR